MPSSARCTGSHQPPASGSEKRSSSMRRPPRRPGHHPPRDGSTDFAEDPSVPEGQAKSAQAPIRRPPSRGGPLHRSALKRPFLLDRAIAQPLAALPLTDAAYPLRVRPVFFSARPKGAPAAPRAVGRGGAPKPTKWARKCPWGARERAQFSHWGPRRAPRGGESRSSEVNEFWPAWPERGMRSL